LLIGGGVRGAGRGQAETQGPQPSARPGTEADKRTESWGSSVEPE